MPKIRNRKVVALFMLTIKQKAFADFYIQLGNATEAAVQAGYSPKTARQTGAENLSKPYIKKYIETRLAELDNERIADQKEVLRYVTSVMRGESQSETVVVEGIGDGMSRATRVIKHPDEKERLKAAEMLGKVHGMFNGSGGEENALDKLDKIIEGINNVANG